MNELISQFEYYVKNHRATDGDNYYYSKDNEIWYSSEGDGIFVAELRINSRFDGIVDDIVTVLNYVNAKGE